MNEYRDRSGSRQLNRSNSATARHKQWASHRSASEGGQPRATSSEKTSKSPSVCSMEVRCACQYYMSDSLLPEKVNPAGSPVHSPVRGRSPRPFHSPIRAVDLPPIRLG